MQHLLRYFGRYRLVILCILIYVLIYFVRLIQGGWNINLDLFPAIRQQLDQQISLLLPSPQAQLLSGILLGSKKDLPAGFKLDLRDTSTLHIVVVSGQNLTFLSGFILNLAGLIKRKHAILLSLGVIFFYTILTGGQIPVIRSVIMVSLSLIAQIYGRQYDGVKILIITAGFLLLINPLWILDLSFQLSFLATLGVVTISPVLVKTLSRFPEILRQDLAVTIGAQLMVTPVILQNFHQLSLISVPANLLIGWTIPYIMILGSIMLFLSYIFTFLAQASSLLVNIFLTYFIYVVHFFASLPFAWEYVSDQVWVVWVGYYFVLAGIMLLLTYDQK